MNTSEIHNKILVEELQLGVQLSESVHTKRRSDFSLMLSMLTDDVLAFSQFKLPQSESPQKIETEDILRKHFELPEKQALALSNTDDIPLFSQAELIQNDQLLTYHLSAVLQPKPLAFRDDKKHIETEVLSNTTLYCQHKYEKKNPKEDNQRLDFKVNEWLKVVQTSLVKAPLLDLAV